MELICSPSTFAESSHCSVTAEKQDARELQRVTWQNGEKNSRMRRYVSDYTIEGGRGKTRGRHEVRIHHCVMGQAQVTPLEVGSEDIYRWRTSVGRSIWPQRFLSDFIKLSEGFLGCHVEQGASSGWAVFVSVFSGVGCPASLMDPQQPVFSLMKRFCPCLSLLPLPVSREEQTPIKSVLFLNLFFFFLGIKRVLCRGLMDGSSLTCSSESGLE